MNSIKYLLSICLAVGICTDMQAQEESRGRIPDEVFYLMPQFGDGVVYFRGQAPANGKLNICAADNTLRFIDDKGVELTAVDADHVLMVEIDGTQFLHDDRGYYRMYPANNKIGIALKRDVHILVGAKKGAYGTVDQTSSIRQYSTLYTESGGMYNLSREVPYEVNEELYLYQGYTVVPFTKKNLKKMFPAKKEEIDAWLKSNHYLPKTVEEALPFLHQLIDK